MAANWNSPPPRSGIAGALDKFVGPGASRAELVLQVSIHLVHLLVVTWLYLAFDLIWFTIGGAYLLFSAALVLLVPQYLQRPVTLAAYTCALLLSMYVLRRPPALEWFLPLFYLKLLVSHLPKEEPYHPS